MNFRSLAALLLALFAASGCDLGTQNRSGGGTEGVGLSGQLLLPDGTPAQGARVYVYYVGNHEFDLAKVVRTCIPDSVFRDSAVSDARGGFEFTRLHPGTYNIEAVKAGDTALGWFSAGVVYSGVKTDVGPVPQPP
jgi:protocatechuate 3,4-dioxygenase beta subunit